MKEDLKNNLFIVIHKNHPGYKCIFKEGGKSVEAVANDRDDCLQAALEGITILNEDGD